MSETFAIWRARHAAWAVQDAGEQQKAAEDLAEGLGMTTEELAGELAELPEEIRPSLDAMSDATATSVLTEPVKVCGREAAVSLFPVVDGSVPAFAWRKDLRSVEVPKALKQRASAFWEPSDAGSAVKSVAWIDGEYPDYAILVSHRSECAPNEIVRSVKLRGVGR